MGVCTPSLDECAALAALDMALVCGQHCEGNHILITFAFADKHGRIRARYTCIIHSKGGRPARVASAVHVGDRARFDGDALRFARHAGWNCQRPVLHGGPGKRTARRVEAPRLVQQTGAWW